MTTWQGTRVLAVVWWHSLRSRTLASFAESRLKTWTLVGFLIVYLFAGFILFQAGMTYLVKLPLMGPVITERVIYLLFFSFFLMLAFSNGIINFMTLYRSKETQWLLSLPIPTSSIVLWKTMETMFLSSWGLILMSAPILLAFGQAVKADLGFYLRTGLLLIPFLIIPACLGTWILLLVVRFYKPWWNKVLVAIFALLGIWLINSLLFRADIANVDPDADEALTPATISGFGSVLRYTEGAMHGLLPSSWLSEAVLTWSRGYTGNALFFTLVLCSHALMGLVVTLHMGKGLFFPGWNASIFRQSHKIKEKNTRVEGRAPFPSPPWWARPFGRQVRALLVKDLYTMWRDGGQRAQFLIVFGLLFFYSLNIQNLGYNLQNRTWLTAVSYLNLVICTLALSMLTTRFIFPQFSMEGQRIWILGMAPLSLDKVFRQKMLTSIVLTATVTMPLITISGSVMGLPTNQVLYFLAALGLMNVGLNGIAVCLGAIFPNFQDPNPARIVSGFGGTLCLLCSFLYILIGMLILLLPALVRLGKFLPGMSPDLAMAAALVLLVLATSGFLWPLTIFAKKQIKKWKF